MIEKKVSLESKYGKKFAARRAADGGAANPRPRPLDPDYLPTHVPHPSVLTDEKGRVFWRNAKDDYINGAKIYFDKNGLPYYRN